VTAAVSVVGGGIAGMVASIACAEAGAQVRLFEAHRELGGRAQQRRARTHVAV
jgi:phytoene dehydrogenase-like protein